tara:strand:- start:740 stop:895 length:156 start_codon:yes stop_codon:yes gene_type:complete
MKTEMIVPTEVPQGADIAEKKDTIDIIAPKSQETGLIGKISKSQSPPVAGI